MSYNDYTCEECQYGHMTFYQVVELAGRHHDEERHGPSCWEADCEAHKRWKAAELSRQD
jgi:hypothetical protein